MNVASTTCASSHRDVDWHGIDWAKCHRTVRRLQARMVKATQEGRHGKVKALQWLLTHSFSAKALAVKRVTENPGKNTPGVDGQTWQTPKAKAQAIVSFKKRGYKPSPLRRVYIPKAKGKRPLGIPTMNDRAMQALYLLALEPISETTADKNSYGFRPQRSTADAIGQCFITLAHKHSAQWILEGDIRSCFDTISHAWMQAHIPIDKGMLQKWLQAGFIDQGILYPTEAGVPQGSPISPTLANMTLDGLERLLVDTFKPRRVNGVIQNPLVHMIRWADDFIVTGRSRALLEEDVKPLIESFLESRGLALSQEKTRITHIDEGFDFLGQTIRKYGGKFLTKPSKQSVKALLTNVRRIIKRHRTASQVELIEHLNPLLRGWTNYHRHVAAKEVFVSIDHRLWQMLWQWAKRRHRNKPVSWIKEKYFKREAGRSWMFACDTGPLLAHGKAKRVRLHRASATPIRRHIKIKAEANPFDPQWESYFECRLARKMKDSLKGRKKLLWLWSSQDGRCPRCGQAISQETRWHVHHLVEKARGGSDKLSNLVMLHPHCHRQVHSQGVSVGKPVPTRGL